MAELAPEQKDVLNRMTDTELLNLIEFYNWNVAPQVNGGWVITYGEFDSHAGDGDETELARTRENLRETIRVAMQAQADLVLDSLVPET